MELNQKPVRPPDPPLKASAVPFVIDVVGLAILGPMLHGVLSMTFGGTTPFSIESLFAHIVWLPLYVLPLLFWYALVQSFTRNINNAIVQLALRVAKGIWVMGFIFAAIGARGVPLMIAVPVVLVALLYAVTYPALVARYR